MRYIFFSIFIALSFSNAQGANSEVNSDIDVDQEKTKRMIAQVEDLNFKIDKLEEMLTVVENKLRESHHGKKKNEEEDSKKS
ncbi:MAG: hypothetical protein K2X98_02265 [Alphaproteobacteria bacterium]|nr:hypothetical protein [Alphaproteobacteria bacterium]